MQALAQFYRSLNSGDLALMEENWETSESVAMDNPLGGIKRGGQKSTRFMSENLAQAQGTIVPLGYAALPVFRGGAQRMLSAPPSGDDGADRGSR